MLSKEDHSVVFYTHTTIPIFTLIHFRSVNPTMRVQPLIVYLTPEQKGYSVTRWVWSFDRLTMSLKVSCLACVMSTTSSLSRYLYISLANFSQNSRTCLLSVWINPLSKVYSPIHSGIWWSIVILSLSNILKNVRGQSVSFCSTYPFCWYKYIKHFLLNQ